MHDKNAQKLAELAPRIMNAFHDLGTQHPKGTKLSMRQFQALIILNANKQLTLSQLCGKLSLAASTGTELVNRMISLEFIKKETDVNNQRNIIISIAPKGLEFLKERQQTLTGMFSRFLSPFNEEDRDTFTQSFQTICDIIAKYKVQEKKTEAE